MRGKITVIRNAGIAGLFGEGVGKGDIVIDESGVITGVGGESGIRGKNVTVIDAAGLYAFPSFTDLHCHLSAPGQDPKAAMISETAAATAGGYGRIVVMPDALPDGGSTESISELSRLAGENARCRILPAASLTHGGGRKINDLDELTEAGAVLFTDVSEPIKNASVLREAMKKCAGKGIPVMLRGDESSLGGGALDDGKTACLLGVGGIPESAEAIGAARALILAGETGCRLHLTCVTSRRTLSLIRWAKSEGIAVTCDTCPHYFSFTSEDAVYYGANIKTDPPVRRRENVEALAEAIADGTIDCISTDHTPCAEGAKSLPLGEAPFGIAGIQTAFGAAVTYLSEAHGISILRLIELMSATPASILGIETGIRVGKKADFVLADISENYVVTKAMLKGGSMNTPYLGMSLRGFIRHVWIDGEQTL